MLFPFCFPIVPVVSDAGMPRVEASLVKKHIKPAFLPSIGKLVVPNPFHQSVEPAMGFLFRIRAALDGFRCQETGASSLQFHLDGRRQRKLAFESGACPESENLPLNISFDSLPKRSGTHAPREFNEPALLFAHFIFVQHFTTALLRGLQPVAERRINGRLRALPLVLTIFPISVEAGRLSFFPRMAEGLGAVR